MSGPGLEELFRLDDEDGPARPLDERGADALVAGAMAHFPPPGGGTPASGSSGGAAAGLAVLGVVTLVGLAVGGAMLVRAPAAPSAPSEARSEPTTREAGDAPQPREPREPSLPAEPSAPEQAPAEAAGDDAPARAPRERARRAPPAPARDLLAEANDLRAARSWSSAERRYLEVVRAHPRSPEAHVARVAAADLRLEHLGNARGAAALYRQARSGRLAGEARFGLARAYRALGDAREADALEALLRHHPRSPFSPAAERRLRELR